LRVAAAQRRPYRAGRQARSRIVIAVHPPAIFAFALVISVIDSAIISLCTLPLPRAHN